MWLAERPHDLKLTVPELKNQPGELAHLGDVCAQRGVNLQLAGVVSGERATILFSSSDEAAVRTALEGAGLEFTERPALQVSTQTNPAKPPSSAGNSPMRA